MISLENFLTFLLNILFKLLILLYNISLPSIIINAYDKLFISSDVQQICIYSLYFFRRGDLSNFDFRKYSTAFTSCLVVFSNFLTIFASVRLNFSKILTKNFSSLPVNLGKPDILFSFDK